MFHSDHRVDFSRLPGVRGLNAYNAQKRTVTLALDPWSEFWSWTDEEREAIEEREGSLPAAIRRLRPDMAVVASDESDCVGVEVPATLEVCDVCEGRSTVVNPSVDGGGITPEEFDDDPGFREAYLAGRFNVQCPKCGGARVYPALNTQGNPRVEALAKFLADEDADERDERIADRHTFYMESGGYGG